jgi:hypothetical protein
MIDEDELNPSDLLAHRELQPPADRGQTDVGDAGPPAGVRCGRPLLYPVPAADLPAPLRHRPAEGRYLGALFAFDLDPLPSRWRYTSARFQVALTDQRGMAVQLHGDGDTFGLIHGEAASRTAVHTIAATRDRPGWLRRLAARPDAPRAWVSGAQSPQFGWVYDDPRGEVLLPRTYGMHALLEVAADAREARGTLDVRVEVAQGSRAKHRFGLRERVPFAEPLPPPDHAREPGGAAVRLCLAVDVSGYSTRSNPATERIQRDLVDLLSRARRAAGIADSAVNPQPQGDGQFTVLPVGIDESAVIPSLIQGLQSGLRALNRAAPPGDRIRLRLALHRGLVKEGANGWIGVAPIAVHRILDSPALRTALREHTAADYVLGLPDVLFQDVVAHAVEPPLPGDFRPVTIDLPEKNFVERGWLHIGPEDNA